MAYYSEREIRQEGDIPKSELGKVPVNPRTGRPYTQASKTWWRWFYGLSDKDKGILADLESQ